MQKQPQNSKKKQAKSNTIKGGVFGGGTTTTECMKKATANRGPNDTGIYQG